MGKSKLLSRSECWLVILGNKRIKFLGKVFSHKNNGSSTTMTNSFFFFNLFVYLERKNTV